MLVGFVLVAAACVVPQTDGTYSFTVQTDVVYGQALVNGGASTTDLLLDLYIPDIGPDEGPMGLMLVIHGGGFVGGSKSQSGMVTAAQQFASRGWVTASIGYRLGGTNPVVSSRVQPIWDLVNGDVQGAQIKGFVSAIDDTLTAIDWLHATQDVYAPWTALYGNSAGAITSLNVGYILDDFGIDGPDILAVISRAGGFYLTPDGSPFEGPDEPPLFVVHGTADTTVPFSLATNIENYAAAAGNPLDFHPIAGGGHGTPYFGVDWEPGTTYFQRSVNFIDEEVFEPVFG
jgi:acetyl esterase/lipase